MLPYMSSRLLLAHQEANCTNWEIKEKINWLYNKNVPYCYMEVFSFFCTKCSCDLDSSAPEREGFRQRNSDKT